MDEIKNGMLIKNKRKLLSEKKISNNVKPPYDIPIKNGKLFNPNDTKPSSSANNHTFKFRIDGETQTNDCQGDTGYDTDTNKETDVKTQDEPCEEAASHLDPLSCVELEYNSMAEEDLGKDDAACVALEEKSNSMDFSLPESDDSNSDVETETYLNSDDASSNDIPKSQSKICVCGKGFPNGFVLQEHVYKDHAGENVFVCHMCGMVFTDSDHFQEHLAEAHVNDYTCDICGEIFSQKNSLRDHVSNVHLKGKYYMCAMCGNTFTNRSNWKKHISIVHFDDKQYTCNICGKSFGYSGHLKTHIATVHLKERNHKCEQCDKSFGQNSTLRKHILTVHYEEKKHTCLICGMKFGYIGHFRRHVTNSHLGDEEYYCDVCPKSFQNVNHLQKHLMLEHRDCNIDSLLLTEAELNDDN